MTIVAAVDRSEDATAVVEQGRLLADAFEEDLHVVHVLSRGEFVDLERTSINNTGQAIDMDRIKEIAAEVAKEAAEDVTTDFKPVGLMGNARDDLTHYANEQGARYIVVGGRKHSPLGKAVFGSTAQSVLLNADRPVVAIRQIE
jgi:nucleotide-binding universal stress UspA family protein